jgi:hypothetical protein
MLYYSIAGPAADESNVVINAEFVFALAWGNISDSCSAVKGGTGVEISDGSPVIRRRP